MADPVIVTVQYTPPGAADSLRLELHAEPGARLTLQLGARTTPASVPTQPQPTDWEDLSGRPKPPASPDWADLSGIRDWDLPASRPSARPGAGLSCSPTRRSPPASATATSRDGRNGASEPSRAALRAPCTSTSSVSGQKAKSEAGA